MKNNNITLVRRQLDKSLSKIVEASKIHNKNQKNWLSVIRQALGMTASQLARRIGVSPAAIKKAEKNEELGTISINTMRKMAEHLECDFVYFLLPKEESLTKTVEKKALEYSKKILNQVSHTMILEEQGINEDEKNQQLKEIFQELISSQNSRIWD